MMFPKVMAASFYAPRIQFKSEITSFSVIIL